MRWPAGNRDSSGSSGAGENLQGRSPSYWPGVPPNSDEARWESTQDMILDVMF